MSQITKLKLECDICESVISFNGINLNSSNGKITFEGRCIKCLKTKNAKFSIYAMIDLCDNKIKWLIWLKMRRWLEKLRFSRTDDGGKNGK
ncbi:MAG: hypothetical protein IIC40_03835 [Candidatus Marinimicrobia bacterium]|nr:hypothetical protein [Candidatus Neomarinimicrobiota bacterium]